MSAKAASEKAAAGSLEEARVACLRTICRKFDNAEAGDRRKARARLLSRLLSGAAMAAALSASPALVLDEGWAPALHWQCAYAKGGNSGPGGGGGSGGGGSGGSGSGGGSGHDGGDNSGPGGGGPGGGDDDRDGSGGGSGGHGGGGDASGGGGDGGDPRSRSGGDGERGDDNSRSGRDVQVSFEDGSQIEVWGGVFENRGVGGDVVSHRQATRDDYDFVEHQGAQLGTFTIRPAEALRLEVTHDSLAVIFSDSQAMAIENELLQLKNAEGEVVLSRLATPMDRTRLEDVAEHVHDGLSGARLDAGVEQLAIERSVIAVVYTNRVEEELVGDRLEIRDPTGNIINAREANPSDRARLEALLER